MPDLTPSPAAEIAELKERASRLAREKAQLQLVALLMARLGEYPGLEKTVEGMLRFVMEILGGRNVTIFYRIDEAIHCVDVHGRKEVVALIEDDLVRQVFETREPASREREFDQTGMTTTEFTKATTWVMPLLVGAEIVGVLRMDDLIVAGHELRDEVRTFLRYASLVLKHEISGETRLRQAFAHLRFTNCLDQVNRAIQGTSDLEQMMSDVLDAVLTIFECDRAFLVYPCDPETPSYRVPMERTRPEFPGALARGLEVPVDPESVRLFQTLRASSGPVTFGPGSAAPLPTHLTERFCVQSQIAMAVYPKLAEPYLFGLHQCSYPRIWTPEETRLLQEIGRRLSDALTSLQTFRDLERSEERYRTLIQRIRAAVVVHGADTRVLTSNLMAQELLGLTEDQLMGKAASDPSWHFSRADGTDLSPEEYPVNRVRATRKPLRDLVARIHRSGSEGASDLWVLANADPVLGGNGEVLQVIVTFIDISELKRLETEQTRTNRALRMLSDSNQALIRITDEATLVNEVCRIAVEVGGYRMAWVGFAEHDDARSVRPVARAGDASEYLDTVTFSWAEDETGRGPVGTSIRTGQPCIVRHIPEDPALVPWRAAAVQHGYGSIIALPLTSEGQTLGALGIYSCEVNAFDTKEVEILAELASDLAFGITAQRTRSTRDQAETALRESQEKFAKAFMAASDSITIVDVETDRFLEVNDAFGRLTGYSREEAIGRTTEELGIWADPAERQALTEILIRDGRLRDALARSRHRSGREFLTELSCELMEIGGRPCVVGRARDVTERREAEEKIQMLLQAIEQSPVSVLIADADGTIEYVNRTFTEVTGYSAKEAHGANPRFLKSGKTPPGTYTELWQTLLAGRTWRGEFVNRKKDGTLYSEQASIAAVRDAAGRTSHYVAVKQDVTANRRAQEELQATRDQLQQAQKMESLGLLAGGVAHDMNNVLAAIVGLADAVSQRHPEDEVLVRALETISGASLRGRTTVRRLLDFARPSLSVERVVDLCAIVREQVALLERTTLSRVRVEIRLESGTCLVRGDPGALSHALMNICVNAVEAMPDGGLLTIVTRRSPERLELSVTDEGRGMDQGVLQRALDPFFTTKPQGKGTGLGLSIVYGVVKAHQGEMKIESEPGKGTTVTIAFPLAAAPEAAPPEAGRASVPRTRGLKVLVVDDDAGVRIAFSILLEALGHVPTAFASGEAALEAVEGGLETDLVVLDLAMPGLGGAGTLPRLRELRPALPVILATGRADQRAAELAESVPGVLIMEKPFNRKELEAVLGALFGDGRG